jgi:hypothetical protein
MKEIDVTGIDLVKFVKGVYERSRPLGLGFIHYTSGPLTDEEAKELIDEEAKNPVCLDYVKGRACKMTVFRKEGGLFIRVPWYDHTNAQLKSLLKEVWPEGVEFPEIHEYEHPVACACCTCEFERKLRMKDVKNE